MHRKYCPQGIDTAILEECYERSLRLLRHNSTAAGITASSRGERSVARHYTSIFGRDAAICALGMALSGEPELITAARAGLATLGRCQAPNGQIPKYVKPETEEVDFWYTGCIDATLWWLIAVKLFERFVQGGPLSTQFGHETARALQWLSCQQHPTWGLLQQNEASDWADIMPRSGFVLYTNALWFWVKRLYGITGADETKEYANLLFFPFDNQVPGHRRARLLVHYIRNKAKRSSVYLSFVNFAIWGDEVDSFGNILACLTGLADTSRAIGIVKALLALEVNRPWPIRVVGTPIQQKNPLWRLYMQRHRQNHPWQYHNGGSWPFVGGFWVMLLSRLGKHSFAWWELERLAEANRANGWEFNEWFHGVSGEAGGMPGQSWNAAMYILAWKVLHGRIRLF